MTSQALPTIPNQIAHTTVHTKAGIAMYENGAPLMTVVGETVVYDPGANRHVLRYPGTAILPAGTVIELSDLALNVHADAVVRNVRMVAGYGAVPSQVFLDCDVPPSWWDAHPYDDAAPSKLELE
jgi:hypothetical protein